MRLGAPRRLLARSPVWKLANHPDAALDAFVAALDGAVQSAAASALDPDGLPDGDGYLELWRDTAYILHAIADGTIDDDDPDELAEARAAKQFAFARFGYAVESIACADPAIKAALPAGCSHQLQASRGMTRPDIVVTHNVQGEIAWFDITAHNSVNHIDRKTGSGWKTRPYVAEITYPTLDLTAIGTGNLGIAERVARRNAMKRRIKTWDTLVVKTQRQFSQRWDDDDGQTLNKADRQRVTREAAAAVVGAHALSPEDTKSLLRAWRLSIKDHGFDSGGSMARGEEILRSVFDV